MSLVPTAALTITLRFRLTRAPASTQTGKSRPASSAGDPTQIAALLTQLSAVQASMAAQLVASATDAAAAGADKLLTIEDAAQRLGVSEDWLYRRTSKLPFVVRVGRHVRFSERGMDRYVKNKMGR